MIRALAVCLMLWPGAALAVDEAAEKSVFFAGRCMAQMLNATPVDIDGLQEMPGPSAAGHLFGSPGQVFYGTDDRVVLILHNDRFCGVNAYDETAEDLGAFLAYWLERDGSPFALTEAETLANGDRRVTYDGHCTECGFDVHARGYWFRAEEFSIYRVYATKPEGS